MMPRSISAIWKTTDMRADVLVALENIQLFDRQRFVEYFSRYTRRNQQVRITSQSVTLNSLRRIPRFLNYFEVLFRLRTESSKLHPCSHKMCLKFQWA